MAPRASWKGQLRLSLVSIPVEIFAATQTGSKTQFRQIHGPSGKRVRYEKSVPGIGPVKTEDIVKGYEVSDDEYILLDPDEIDAIRLESKKTLEIVQFVGSCEIPPLYYDRPYYILPADDLAEEAYRVVRDALRSTERTGLGQLTMRGREHLVAIRPCGDGLLLETLRYAEEVRAAEPMFSAIEDAPPEKDLLDVATSLIDRKTAPFDATAFSDNYETALRELIEARRKDRKTRRVTTDGDKAPQGENVVDLMAALRGSLKKAGGAKPAAKGRAPRKPAARKKPA